METLLPIEKLFYFLFAIVDSVFSDLADEVECCLPNTHHILVLGGRHLRFPAEGKPTKSRQEMTKTVCPLLIYGQGQNGSPVSST